MRIKTEWMQYKVPMQVFFSYVLSTASFWTFFIVCNFDYAEELLPQLVYRYASILSILSILLCCDGGPALCFIMSAAICLSSFLGLFKLTSGQFIC